MPSLVYYAICSHQRKVALLFPDISQLRFEGAKNILGWGIRVIFFNRDNNCVLLQLWSLEPERMRNAFQLFLWQAFTRTHICVTLVNFQAYIQLKIFVFSFPEMKWPVKQTDFQALQACKILWDRLGEMTNLLQVPWRSAIRVHESSLDRYRQGTCSKFVVIVISLQKYF